VKTGWKDGPWIGIAGGVEEGQTVSLSDSAQAEKKNGGEQQMIEMSDLEKTYNSGAVATQVLRGVSFRIQAGEYVAIMGTSGTGKSTLMNIIGCLDKLTSGRYSLNGTEVGELDDDALSHLRNHEIGFVFQQFHLLSRASALKNVMLPLIYSDEYPEDAEERATKMLESVGLADRVNYRPSELSGGEQQRVAIARALVTRPSLILADEPTGNLDRRSGLEVLAIFRRLNREGRTIIMVTHDEAVAEHASRIIQLKEGRVASDRVVPEPRDPEQELDSLKREAQ
jgi:ABC-type lipoprotein export system ATPase subunit